MSRRKAREAALQCLYQMDLGGENASDALDSYFKINPLDQKDTDFTERIVKGVASNKEKLDTLISRYSLHWKISRMPDVDRNILRIAVYEFLFCEDIPVNVTINEAIELGKRFSTEKSGTFINGVLDKISKSIEIRKLENP